jgi:AGZA family xanthine/uracil permease-like MFS transporter
MSQPSRQSYRWASTGDINAFSGLMLDNIAGLILLVSLLSGFGMPTDFIIAHMIPGTAIGVLVGDLLFFMLAFRLAARTNSPTVTAMPLGLDTPSTFGMCLFVLGPAYLKGTGSLGMEPVEAARYAWHIGICSIFLSGWFKLVCAFGSNWARQAFPRAGLLGSLAAIALVLISFLPLLEILHAPLIGLIALSLTLTALIGRIPLPGRLPGAVGAAVIATALYYLLIATGIQSGAGDGTPMPVNWLPTGWTEALGFTWLERMGDAVHYLPIVLPFALGTVIGGIDCTESAAAAGDHYKTGQVIGVEALATLIASMCGGVIQTTPYIGHPAYKAMGGRAAYALATALFIGAAGCVGFFSLFYEWIPKAAVFPILVFIGLEITGQSFHATPVRHYPAVALACLPALAVLALHFPNQILGSLQLDPSQLGNTELSHQLQTASWLANGFIVTSLLWASTMAMIIDRRLPTAALFLLAAAILSLFGVIHSPLPANAMFVPWQAGQPGGWSLPVELRSGVLETAGGYLICASLLAGWGVWLNRRPHTAVPADLEQEGTGI